METSKRIRVAVLFGGKSAERDISIQSARNVVRAFNRRTYDVILVGIDEAGVWTIVDERRFLAGENMFLDGRKGVRGISRTNRFPDELIELNGEGRIPVDVVFPVLHGPFGEDGTVQGLLKLAGIPFIGAGVLGSAIGIDKDVTKRLLRDAGIPTARFVAYGRYERDGVTFEEVGKILGVPFFVKPASLGSSVGITKVHDKSEFGTALSLAFSYDRKILVEEYIEGREVECALLGNERPVASVCGEVIPRHEFYSYEAKYLDENGAVLLVPTDISEGLSGRIRELALQAYKTLCCEGMARVDFFVTEDQRVVINEINTIPGFTSVSMYPKLWEASGIPYEKLIDTLVRLALDRSDEERKLRTTR